MLTKTEVHKELADRIANQKPYWPDLISKFERTFAYQNWKKTAKRGRDDLAALAGPVAETHVHSLFEKARSELNLNGRLMFNQIPNGTNTENYTFMRDSAGRLCVMKDGQNYSEIDDHFVLDGIPTVVEVKIKKHRQAYDRKKQEIIYKGRQELNEPMREEGIEKRTAPVLEFFKVPEVSFLYVMPGDQINPGSSRQREFVERGGIIVPFYTDQATFHKEAEDARVQLKRRAGLEGLAWTPFASLPKDLFSKDSKR